MKLVGENMNIIKVDISSDQTKKYFFRLSDSQTSHIEACLLNLSRYGYIICVSSQVGCSQKCKFCAASKSELIRNLTSEEIQEQISLIIADNTQLQVKKFQVTYMGSGEPLSNYKNVFDSIDYIRKRYFNLSKVNISTTCPIVGEKCFIETDWEKYKNFLHFQYSLHFSNDFDRYRYLWPYLLEISVAVSYLNKISCILNDTYKVNYIPFDGLNDNENAAAALEKVMYTTRNAKLKISKMSEIDGSYLLPSQSFDKFVSSVKQRIDEVEVFCSDGTDVNAGCGQFYNESIV